MVKRMSDEENGSGLSPFSVERLYSYYILAQRAQEQGATHISSRQLAQYLLIGDTQVRKDMAAINLVGKPKRGYHIDAALVALREAMGINQAHHAVLCGTGKLGRALLEYSRFNEFGFRLVGAFDIREDVIGHDIAGMRVLPVDHLEKVIEIFSVEIGILAVNVWAAQGLCDRMVKCGVKAVWNFAPIHLHAPPEVLIRHEDFAGSLTVISHWLQHQHSSGPA